MEPDSSVKSRLVMAAVMMALGLFAVWAGGRDILRHWPYLAFGARVCDVLIVVSGLLLLIAGLWHALTRGRPSAALGSLAAGLFAVTLLTGVLTGAIPCSGPS